MGATGLVAFIVTVHQVAAGLGLLVMVVLALLGALLVRGATPLRKLALVVCVSVGAGAVTFAVTARVLRVPTIDVEIVRAR